jgi:hypothetical protein
MRYLCGRDVGRTRLDRPRIYPLLHVVNGLSPAQDLGLLSHGGGSWSLRASASGMGGRQTTGDRLSSPGTLQNLFAHAMGALIAAPPGHDPTILAKPGLPTPPAVRVGTFSPSRRVVSPIVLRCHTGTIMMAARSLRAAPEGHCRPEPGSRPASVWCARRPGPVRVRVTGRPCRSCQPELTRSESGGICFIWHPSDGLQSPQGAHCR